MEIVFVGTFPFPSFFSFLLSCQNFLQFALWYRMNGLYDQNRTINDLTQKIISVQSFSTAEKKKWVSFFSLSNLPTNFIEAQWLVVNRKIIFVKLTPVIDVRISLIVKTVS